MSRDHEFNVKDQKKRRVALLGVSSVMLLAMVVAVTVGMKETGGQAAVDASGDDGHDAGLSTSSRAAKSVCHTVQYRHSCERALARVHTSDPRKLVQSAFGAALDKLEGALANSSTIKAAKDDRRTEGALETCKQVMQYGVSDLKRSIDQMTHFDIYKIDEHVENMRVWLSGALTLLETCTDAFENTTGDAGDKMKALLNTTKELTFNGVDVATGLYTILKTFNVSQLLDNLPGQLEDHDQSHDESHDNDHRSLLRVGEGKGSMAEEIPHGPHWVNEKQRRLLSKGGASIKADVVVAKDGSGKFKTIKEALNEVPLVKDVSKVATNGNKSFVIYIKEGVYEEEVRVEETMANVMFLGDGPNKTVITGKKNFADGFVLYKTATVSIMGNNFIAKDIGFENSAGAEKHQAIALLVQSDMSVFYNCHINGYMNTLSAHSYRQFYRHCTISGTLDFIFGNAAAVFQKCKLVIRKPLDDQECVVTAQSRLNDKEPSGFVLQNCTVMADPSYYPVRDKNKAYLGRPAKKYSRTIVMQSNLGDSIAPEGWKSWMGSFGQDTCVFGEFDNRGPGSGLSGRVKWPAVEKLTEKDAEAYDPAKFLGGDRWILPAGIPYQPGTKLN